MTATHRVCPFGCLLATLSVPCLLAQAPQNLGVTFNGDDPDTAALLAADKWHVVTALYRYPGKIDTLTNTFMAVCRGSDPRSGLYVGYHLPTNQLMFVRHGTWNTPEVTGQPGEAGKVIGNDQGDIDCEKTRITKTADEIAVSYRLRFRKGVFQGGYNVLQYVEDKDVNHDGFSSMGTVTIDRDTAVHRTDMPRRWRSALTPRGRASPALLLADDGQAKYALVVPANATRIEQKAARDLGQYLTLISGADFPVTSEGSLPEAGHPFISVGRTQLLQAVTAAWRNADLAVEGYAIEVVDRNVYLYGGSGRGLLHGVYSLLEEDLGCRWYALDSVDTPQMRRLAVKLVSRQYVPVLELRDPYIRRMHDPAWSLRNKTNTPHARIPLAWGGSLRYHHMGHTYATYFPTRQYFAEHPEYYALVNGKRQPTQLCHTNEDVIRLSIEKTCQIFRDHPDVTITAIGPNDGRGFCDCPDCKRLDDANGGRSGSYFYHLNRIAEGVKKEYPANHIISLAYLDYAKPPTAMEVDDSIIIQLCTDSHAWRYQFCFVSESEEFQEAIKAWQAAQAKVYLWDYTTDYVHFLVPMANWAVVAGNTRFNVQHGVRGIMYESEANDCDEMRAWVWAKQLWNPDLDTKALMKDFVFGYYKESAPSLWDYQMMMWDYWEKWHKVPHRCGQPSDNPLLNNLHCSYAPDGPMFTPDFMAAMRECFAGAEKAAASEEVQARVQGAKISLLYLELAQNIGYYSEFGDFVHGRRIREPRANREMFKQYLDEFVAIARKNQLTTFGIPITFEKITARWRAAIEAESTPLPKVGLPADWVFAADPDDRGVVENWHRDPRYYEAAARPARDFALGRVRGGTSGSALARLHINRGVGWEQQGFPGLDGYGWYFQSFTIPEDVVGREHVYLYFLGVNEQAWVYVNGEAAFERTYASTGKAVGELRTVPFSGDIKKYLMPGAANRVAIRVTHASGLGGIWLPAMLFGTDRECTTDELRRYRE